MVSTFYLYSLCLPIFSLVPHKKLEPEVQENEDKPAVAQPKVGLFQRKKRRMINSIYIYIIDRPMFSQL